MSPELTQRLQTMARELANLAQGIEQLKNSQEKLTRDNATVAEQLKEALSQMIRDDAAAAEQLKAALSQLTRDNAAIVEQLKTSQEQTARPRAPRMPLRVEPQPEARIRRLDAY
jgi:ABC-type transporter Mla subunit MlaD